MPLVLARWGVVGHCAHVLTRLTFHVHVLHVTLVSFLYSYISALVYSTYAFKDLLIRVLAAPDPCYKGIKSLAPHNFIS